MGVTFRGFSFPDPKRDARLCLDCVTVMSRSPRSPLMKLLPGSRLYRCDRCGSRLFTALGLQRKLD